MNSNEGVKVIDSNLRPKDREAISQLRTLLRGEHGVTPAREEQLIAEFLAGRAPATTGLERAGMSLRTEEQAAAAMPILTIPNSVRGQAISIRGTESGAVWVRSLPFLPGVVPAEVLVLSFAARVFHHFAPWVGDLAGFTLAVNLVLVAMFAAVVVERFVLQRHSRLSGHFGHGAAVSGLVSAAILGPLWWNVYTYGEVSLFRILPYVYCVVLILLVGSVGRAYARRHSPESATGRGMRAPSRAALAARGHTW